MKKNWFAIFITLANIVIHSLIVKTGGYLDNEAFSIVRALFFATTFFFFIVWFFNYILLWIIGFIMKIEKNKKHRLFLLLTVIFQVIFLTGHIIGMIRM
jgi:hypothetical protein